MKKTKKVTVIFSLVWTLMMLCVVTYSWIARSWTPKLQYSEIAIATTGALVININDEIYNEVNINDFNKVEEFALKQVSSRDGIEFVSVDYNPILEGKVPVYDRNVVDKYIETEFWLKTQYQSNSDLANQKKEVFLHPDTDVICDILDENGARVDYAIRVCIDVQNVGTYILCKGNPNDSNYESGVYSKIASDPSFEGLDVFSNFYGDPGKLNPLAYAPVTVYDFKYFNGELGENGKNKVLFTINSSAAIKITVRIWLEGCDENCVNEIAGEKFSLLLKFDSREIIENSEEESE